MTIKHTPPLTYDEARTIARSQPGVWPQSVVDEANEVLDRERYRQAGTKCEEHGERWCCNVQCVKKGQEMLARQKVRPLSEPNLWAPFDDDDDDEGDGSAWGLVFVLSAAFWLVLGAAFFLGGLW